MKRSKNIFNSPIPPESLLDDENNLQFRIEGKEIKPNWLQGESPEMYLHYVYSSMHLADHQQRLQEQHDNSASDVTQLTNHFLTASLKMKIDNFSLMDLPKKEQPEMVLPKEPPNCSNLIVQKITGFLNSSLVRKCKVDSTNGFHIETKKDEKQPYLFLGIAECSMELEEKASPQTDEQFQLFTWLEGQTHRLRIRAARNYCIYGSEPDLRAFQRYFKVQNFERKKLGVFDKLNSQFIQKAVYLFGNKVRFYEHNLKIKRLQRQIANKYAVIDQQEEAIQEDAKARHHADNQSVNSRDSQTPSVSSQFQGLSSSRVEPMNLSFVQPPSPTLPLSRKMSVHKKQTQSAFKLRGRSGTVYYDELEEGITFEDSPAYNVGDIRLNLKDTIGISDVDEESDNSVQPFKKDTIRLKLKNDEDSDDFNINIHEVSSNNISSISKGQDSFQSHPAKISVSGVSPIQSEKKVIGKTRSEDQLTLLLLDGSNEDAPEHFASTLKEVRKQLLIKNFAKKPPKEFEYEEIFREKDMHLSVEGIEMMLPYNRDNLDCEVLQLDPWIERDRHFVHCAKLKCVFEEVEHPKKMRYMRYVNHGPHFKISRESTEFVLIIKHEVKDIWIGFHLEAMPKYQINSSQLLVKTVSTADYQFAAILHMHLSPEPISVPPPLTTVEFMLKYVVQSNYVFKKNFIGEKRTLHELRKQWHQMVMEAIIEDEDEVAFDRAVFGGMPDSVFRKLVTKVGGYNEAEILEFSDADLRIIENNIISSGIYDIRIFMKPSSLITKVAKAKKNQCILGRFSQVYLYLLSKNGSARNLGYIFIKEILSKIEQVVVMARREEEVNAIVDLYFEVQYEVDQLFMEISKYFKKGEKK